MKILHLTQEERHQFNRIADKTRKKTVVLEMKKYIQHGRITTYDHCEHVARASFLLNRRFHLHAREDEMVRGALLHDLFLYDWHAKDGGTHRLHGFSHPDRALGNAGKHFSLSTREKDIIRNHMWPLTLRHVPRSRESVIVCVADKLCSLRETLFMRR